jgi:hypothetical protein
MPPQPQPHVEPSEIDDDHDVDILPDDAPDDEVAPAEYPANPAFRTPHPGEALDEDEIEADLDDES